MCVPQAPEVLPHFYTSGVIKIFTGVCVQFQPMYQNKIEWNSTFLTNINFSVIATTKIDTISVMIVIRVIQLLLTLFYFVFLYSFSSCLCNKNSRNKLWSPRCHFIGGHKCHLCIFLFSHRVLTLEACHLKLRSLYFDIVHAFCILMDVQCTISHTVHEIREYIFIYEKIL